MMDQRHIKRLHTVQNLYSYSFHAKKTKSKIPFKKDLVTDEVMKYLAQIDKHIQNHAPKYPLEKIAKIDISILRLAVYELLFKNTEPVKVIINEAIELAKELGNDRSYAFDNAVLGSLYIQITTKEHSYEPETESA